MAVEQQLQMQKRQLEQAEQRYRASGKEKDMITENLLPFQQLIAQGFIGEEQRAQWMDTLRDAQLHHKLFGMNYKISPRQIYAPPFSVELGRFHLQHSEISLELPSLDEDDVLMLLSDMMLKTGAKMLPRDCVMSRNGATVTEPLSVRLNVSCEIDALTLSEPSVESKTP